MLSELAQRLDRMSAEERHYVLNLPRHLSKAQLFKKYTTLLMDHQFVAYKLEKGSPEEIINDYNNVYEVTAGIENGIAKQYQKSFTAIRDAIRLSSGALVHSPSQLKSQMVGRLFNSNDTLIKTFLVNAEKSNKNPWLRPLSPTLNQAGNRLVKSVRTLSKSYVKVAVNCDGTRFVALLSGWSKSVEVWDLTTYSFIRAFKIHDYTVSDVVFMPDGRRVISASWDKTIKIWDVDTGQIYNVFDGHEGYVVSISTSSDGRYLASSATDFTVRVWDLWENRIVRILGRLDESIEKVCVTDKLEYLITASTKGTVTVWNLGGDKVKDLGNHVPDITALVVSEENKKLYVSGGSCDVAVWDLHSLKKCKPLKGHKYKINDLKLISDSQWLISCSVDDTIKLWDVQKSVCLETLHDHSGGIISIDVNQNSNLFISTGYRKSIKFWCLGKLTESRQINGHHGGVRAMLITPDGSKLITGAEDALIHIWNAENGDLIKTIKGHQSEINAFAITETGQYLFCGSDDKVTRVWDLSNAKEQMTFVLGAVYGIKITPDNSTVVFNTGNPYGGRPSFYVWKGEKCRRVGKHRGIVLCMQFTPDSRYMISGANDKTVKMWDIQTGKNKFVFKGHRESVTALAISDDGKELVSADACGEIKIWNLEDGNEICSMRSRRDAIREIVFVKDRKWIITSSDDGRVLMWNMELGLLMAILYSHQEPIADMAISKDKKRIATVAKDGELKLWSLRDNKLEAAFYGDGPFNCCLISNDGTGVFAAEESGKVHLLKLENERCEGDRKLRVWHRYTEWSEAEFCSILKRMLSVLSEKNHVSKKIKIIQEYGYFLTHIQKDDIPFLQEVKEQIILSMGHISDHPRSKELRALALEVCKDFGYRMVLQLLEMCDTEPWQFYSNTIIALGEIAPFYPDVIELLKKASKDPRSEVRKRVVWSIDHYETEETYCIVKGLINDCDQVVSNCAKEVLQRWENEVDPAKKFWRGDAGSRCDQDHKEKNKKKESKSADNQVLRFRQLIYDSHYRKN